MHVVYLTYLLTKEYTYMGVVVTQFVFFPKPFPLGYNGVLLWNFHLQITKPRSLAAYHSQSYNDVCHDAYILNLASMSLAGGFGVRAFQVGCDHHKYDLVQRPTRFP